MTVKIAFLDPAGGDYTPDTPRLHPLGGSQSALCYLAEALAASKLEVTLVNGTRTPGMVRGCAVFPQERCPGRVCVPSTSWCCSTAARRRR